MKKNKAVFLDRDGTIVVHEPYFRSTSQLKLLPNVTNSIRRFREHGYLIIVVTNQVFQDVFLMNRPCSLFMKN